MSGLRAAARRLVERPLDAALFRDGRGVFTAERFLRDAERLAGDLPEADHLCNLCEDRYRFTVAIAASVLRGQVCLLSSDRSPATLRGLGDRFGRVASIAETATADSPLPHHVLTLPDDPVRGAVANPAIPADQLAAIVFTSGSTGIPVGFAKRWGALAARSAAAGRRFAMAETAPASIVGTVPPQHMYGFETTILQPLHSGAASWAGAAFYPADIRDALLAMPAPRALVTTPLQIRALLDSGIPLPPLAQVISATAPLAPELAAAAEQRWRTEVLEIYGATEVGSIASRRTIEGPLWTSYDGISLEADPASDQVRVTAPHAEPHALADMVERCSPTEFTLLGRNADMVKLGGRRASLGGLNAILTSLPGVEDGTFFVPDDLDQRPGARLLAVVVAPDRAAEEILADLRNRVDSVFVPRRIMRVDALPRNATGKLPRAALLSLLPRHDEA